jgi:hypothetical protein
MAATEPRPTAGTYAVPSSMPRGNPPQPHSAFDGMTTPPSVKGADGNEWECLPTE